MTSILVLWILSQPAPTTGSLNLNQQPIESRQGGVRIATTRQYAVNCGANMTCTVSGGQLTLSAASGSGGYSTIEDEGVPLTQRTTLNFTGAGITCVDSGGETVCTVSGGGGGSVNTASGTVTFGTNAYDATQAVAAAWATGASAIVCKATGEEASVEGLDVTVISQGAGTFTVRAEPRTGTHTGALPFVCLGD